MLKAHGRIIKHLLFLVFFTSQSASALPIDKENIHYDFSAIPYAITLANQLRSGSTPTDSEWKLLFDQPAYQLVFKISSLNAAALKTRFTHAFHPDYKDSPQTLSSLEATEVIHLRRALLDTHWIGEYQHQLIKNNTIEKAFNLAKRYLPQEVSSNGNIRFVYGIFGQNAHASQVGIILDPYLAYLSSAHAPCELEAHELHHHLRTQIKTASPLDRNNIFDRTVYHLIHEGVANLIDKENALKEESYLSDEIRNLFKQSMQQAPKNLETIDKLLSEVISQDKPHTFTTIQQQALPLWGHSLGWYMTQTIMNAGLHKELIDTLYNQRQLPALYNKAVAKRKLSQPIFSKPVLAELARRSNNLP